MLDEYGRKRDFTRTPEPPPERDVGHEAPLSFVVQKHSARRLHYDFRLEVNGVMKSWAVPAGPSLNPGTKRLAVMVEDHPLDYASFEGVIPPGQYGSGQVVVWDNGTYEPSENGKPPPGRSNAEETVSRGLARGKLSFNLHGRKLKGSWALVQIRGGRNPKGENWLLIKHQDEHARATPDPLEDDRSVISGLTIEDLKAGRSAMADTKPDIRLPGGIRKEPFPELVLPMLATPTDAPFSGKDWLFEPKLDGFRMIAFIDHGKVRIQSRNGIDDTARFPDIAQQLRSQVPAQLVLDGEVVALENGRPCFQCLQQSLIPGASQASGLPIVYYVFDLLYMDGHTLFDVKLQDRKSLLEQVLQPSDTIQIVGGFQGDGEAIYQAMVKQGIEGVVAKKKASAYKPGTRSRDWLKVKASLSDEFVIGGYSAGQGARSRHFGSLLLGQYDDNGELVYTGNVGTGFNEQLLEEMKARLDIIRSEVSPFKALPPHSGAVTWVRPELVAEVNFAQWTHDGMLRAPVFIRLREDKPAEETHRVEIVRQSESGRMSTLTEKDDMAGEDILQSVLQQLKTDSDQFLLKIGGHRFQVSNPGKPLWPATDGQKALTKRDLLVYLARVSGYILPHLKDRPLTLTRYPDGIGGDRFYQKHYPHRLPSFVETVPIYSAHDKESVQDYLMCNNLATLLWLGQIADLEIHTWFSRATAGPDGPAGELLSKTRGGGNKAVSYPDFIVFDLDPYIYSGKEKKGEEPELNRKAFQRTSEATMWLKEVLDSLSLPAYVKSTGKTGIHVYVPVLRQFGFRAVRSAAEIIGRYLLSKHPRDITMEWAVERRNGKIFLDHNRNARGQTLASVYSPRPSPQAAVSMPLRWDELGKVYPTDFTILNSPQRLAETGDLWADILEKKGDLKKLLRK